MRRPHDMLFQAIRIPEAPSSRRILDPKTLNSPPVPAPRNHNIPIRGYLSSVLSALMTIHPAVTSLIIRTCPLMLHRQSENPTP